MDTSAAPGRSGCYAGEHPVDQVEHGLAAQVRVAHQVHLLAVDLRLLGEGAAVHVVVALLHRPADQRAEVVLAAKRHARGACGPSGWRS